MPDKKKLKRIKMPSLPFMVMLGGGELSNDQKIMFKDKATQKHFTIRFMADKENGKLILNFHMTDETKDKRKEEEKREAYSSSVGIIFDTKKIGEDNAKIEEKVKEMMSKKVYLIDNKDALKGLRFVPLFRDSRLFTEQKSGEELIMNDTGLVQMVAEITSIEDLEQRQIDRAMVQQDNVARGAVFTKEGKWYYIDIRELGIEMLKIVEPYISTEGISKEEFMKGLEKISQASQQPALP